MPATNPRVTGRTRSRNGRSRGAKASPARPLALLLAGIITPEEDEECDFDPTYVVSGSNDDPETITTMAYTIDDGLPLALMPPYDQWSFHLSAGECPDINTYYLLTVYVWRTTGNVTPYSVRFKRVS